MSDEYHALASPSSAHRWMRCANSLAMEIGQPEGDTKAADLGTDKHELLTLCLEFNQDAMQYEGHVLKKGHTVNKELAADVQTVLDNVRERIRAYELRGARVEMDLEQDVPIGHITGEEGATGRVDISLRIYWPTQAQVDLEVIDAKFGYQEVRAEENEQLKLYAEGALEKFSLVDDFDGATLVIEQPLRSSSSIEAEIISAGSIRKWAADTAGPAAQKALMIHRMVGERALRDEDFAPSEKACQWCKAKAVCPALLAKVEAVVEEGFETLDPQAHSEFVTLERLGEIFPHLELIEDWIKAVRARIEVEVFAGHAVPGVKVVAGRKGNRAWSSDEEAEKMLKEFRVKVDQMYSFKLLGPKPILELLKDQPRRLKKIEQLVVQPDGKPHVVHESDKRPAIDIKPTEDGFETVDDLC